MSNLDHAMTWPQSRARYNKPLSKPVDVALSIALLFSSPEKQLMALYEIDARTGYRFHDDLVGRMQELERKVDA